MSVRNNTSSDFSYWSVNTLLNQFTSGSLETQKEINLFVKKTLENTPEEGNALIEGLCAVPEFRNAFAANGNVLQVFCDLYPLDNPHSSLETVVDQVCQERKKQLFVLKEALLTQRTTHPLLSSLQQVGNDSKAIFAWFQANISALESVTELNVQFFKKMPSEICLFKNLQNLTLQQSQIKNLSSIVLANLPQLRRLDLSMNSLASIPEDGFASLSQLQYLDLSYNPINKIAKGSFQGLDQLESLNISRTSHSIIFASGLILSEEAFKNLSRLKYLYLVGNRIYQFSSQMFAGLSALEYLDLSDNMSIEGGYNIVIPDGTFEALSNLKSLKLSRNLIDTIFSKTFAGLVALQHLDLSFTRILTIQDGAFHHLSHLVHLLLCVEKIGAISTQTFAGLSDLKQLRLDVYSEGGSLSAGVFSDLRALQLLQLRSFYGATIQIPPGTFTGLTQVVGLECNGDCNGELQLSIATNTLQELEGLEQLFLRYCRIE